MHNSRDSDKIYDLVSDVSKILASDEHYKSEILELRKEILESNKQVRELLDWKRDVENTNKILLRVAMCASMVATSLGVWLQDIKGFLKTLFTWAAS